MLVVPSQSLWLFLPHLLDLHLLEFSRALASDIFSSLCMTPSDLIWSQDIQYIPRSQRLQDISLTGTFLNSRLSNIQLLLSTPPGMPPRYLKFNTSETELLMPNHPHFCL